MKTVPSPLHIQCVECSHDMPSPLVDGKSSLVCESCTREYTAWIFPAMHKPITANSAPGSGAWVEGEASCFFHPTKQAVTPCEQCGRFVCSLCDLEISGKHFCPSCLDTGKKSTKARELENSRATHDSAALIIASASTLMWFITFLTAPVAIYYAIRSFKSPGSLVRRRNWRAPLAIFIAVLQLVAWGAILVSMLR